MKLWVKVFQSKTLCQQLAKGKEGYVIVPDDYGFRQRGNTGQDFLDLIERELKLEDHDGRLRLVHIAYSSRTDQFTAYFSPQKWRALQTWTDGTEMEAICYMKG